MYTIDRVLQLAKEKGISQAFICGKLGLRRNYLSDVRIGKDNLSDDRLVIIADILNTTPEYLKGETDKKERPDTQSIKPNDKDMRLVNWFRSLPVEKRKAILDLGDGPKDLVE